MSMIEIDAEKKKATIKKIMTDMGLKQEDIADEMGVSISTISRRLQYGSWLELSKIESTVIELARQMLDGELDPKDL